MPDRGAWGSMETSGLTRARLLPSHVTSWPQLETTPSPPLIFCLILVMVRSFAQSQVALVLFLSLSSKLGFLKLSHLDILEWKIPD